MGLLTRNRWRIPLLLGSSALAVYAFQPALPVRGLDFWLPTATLALDHLDLDPDHSPLNSDPGRINWPAAAILGGIVLSLGLTRYLGFSLYLTASRPPQTTPDPCRVGSHCPGHFFMYAVYQTWKGSADQLVRFYHSVIYCAKSPALAELVSKGLRSLNHQSTSLALAQDLRWLGFSYIAFRLLHTIRDRQSGRLPVVSLSEYVVYVIFFPTLTAGPIDRIERFIGDLRHPQALTADDLGEAGKRLMIGLFKKFAIADVLAMIALNATNALQVHSTGWAWVLLYAFAFQIYFDFSGYTDIAIGLGRLLGIKLPENFKCALP